MVKYGTFDENVRSRDIVSDRSKDKLAWTILTAVIIRTAGPFVLAYDKNELPHFSFLSPFKIGWWLIGIGAFEEPLTVKLSLRPCRLLRALAHSAYWFV